MLNSYEILFLLDSNRAAEVDAARDQLHQLLEKFGAEIVLGRVWDEKRLAYPIGNMKKGLYYLVYANIDSARLPELEHEFRLSELIVRQMILKIHPKWLEKLLSAAREERTPAPSLRIVDDDPLAPTRPAPRPMSAGPAYSTSANGRDRGGRDRDDRPREDRPRDDRPRRDAEGGE